MSEIKYYLGIDGGGTKTAFALADTNGNVLKETTLGATNPNDVGFDQTYTTLKKGIETVCCGYPYHFISAFAGLAGCSSAENMPKIRDYLSQFGFAKANNHNDAWNAVSAALGNEDGIVVIMGTGSIAYAKSGTYLRRIGGYGYLFGDAGSGFAIGKDVILAALQEEDQSGEKTLLHGYVKEMCGSDTVLGSIDHFYKEGKREIARYAPLAFKAYEKEDVVAKRIIWNNLSAIASLIKAGCKTVDTNPIIITLCGGLTAAEAIILPILHTLLESETRRYEIKVCKQPPVYGALRLAGMPTKQ